MNDAKMWKLRERALAMGATVFCIAFSVYASFQPQQFADMVTSYPTFAVAGMFMIMFGLLSGASHGILIAVNRWYSEDKSDLTEWEA